MSAASLTSVRVTYIPVIIGLTLGLFAWFLLFSYEIQAAVGVWMASDTYGHCFLILPMAFYLAWDRRDTVAGLVVRPVPALAALALPIAAVWFLAERMGVMEGRQLAAVAALELMFLAVLGWQLFRALLAPLLFLVFLVPFGAFATPALQQFTAWFIVTGLNAMGIANYSTDLTIEISAGVFYVAEACAGLRFLIAAVAFGVFYALLNYSSPGRRAAFIAASIFMPILANGVRALGIVVLGSILGSAEAAAADHIIYGWVFFSVVMLLLVIGGMPFREASPGAGPHPRYPAPLPGSFSPIWASPAAAALAVTVLLASGPAVSMALANRVAPVFLNALPSFMTPADCTAGNEPSPALPAQRIVLTYVCKGRPLVVTIQAFPNRSTPDSLIRERRRITGELDSEDATVGALPVAADGRARPDNGVWLLVHTKGPFRATTVASWTDGAPTKGGIAGRIRQARNSLLGTDFAPLLITTAINLPSQPGILEQKQIDGILRSFVDAQDGLTSQVAAISRAVRP